MLVRPFFIILRDQMRVIVVIMLVDHSSALKGAYYAYWRVGITHTIELSLLCQ